MNRLWLGIALLVGVLALGMLASSSNRAVHARISRELAQAAVAAAEEQWDSALSHSHSAREEWESSWHFTAALSDHGPMETIDMLFASLEVCARQGDPFAYAQTATQLSTLTQAMGEAHSFTWWNLL